MINVGRAVATLDYSEEWRLGLCSATKDSRRGSKLLGLGEGRWRAMETADMGGVECRMEARGWQ